MSFVVDTPIFCAELYLFLSAHLTNLPFYDHSTTHHLVLCLPVPTTVAVVAHLLSLVFYLGYDAVGLLECWCHTDYSVLLTGKFRFSYILLLALSPAVFFPSLITKLFGNGCVVLLLSPNAPIQRQEFKFSAIACCVFVNAIAAMTIK
ncbi:hypothetical protein [Nostoc commune]|uniref:hypothetical protein n=1 Tax=Nostoc commune TaxID=1178 RepID=UPI00207471BB|nr:hypothetical protein [Nostoc commune]